MTAIISKKLRFDCVKDRIWKEASKTTTDIFVDYGTLFGAVAKHVRVSEIFRQ